MRFRSTLPWVAALAALAVASSLFVGLAVSQESDPLARCRSPHEPPDPLAPDLDCAAPPNTFDVTQFFAADATPEVAALTGPTWDSWAWATFAAMNWPAKPDSSGESGYVRGVPDLTKSFAGGGSVGQSVVWETLKEKRELFNTGDKDPDTDPPPYPSSVNQTSSWQDLTYAESQTVGGGIKRCGAASVAGAEAETDTMRKVDPTRRIFAQRGKSAGFTDLTENDETIEVASQACEAAQQLCAGLPATATATAPSMQDCLDNIFPGTVAGVCDGENVNKRTPVGPRVWMGDPGTEPTTARPVYFEVKINYDFWRYILERKYYLDENLPRNTAGTLTNPARADHPKLPFRTSSGQGPGRSTNAVFDYDANNVVDGYRALADPNVLPGVGSVQLKAGWVVLTADDDKTKYHTAEGYYFRDKTPGSEERCAQEATFGLLGLHIIQRVHSLEPVNRVQDFAYGGTFVFATWEHIGLGDYNERTDFTYANYLAFGDNFFKQGGPIPPVTGTKAPFAFETNDVPFPYFKAGVPAIPVVRQHPYPLDSTVLVNDAAHAAIRAENPDSVWLNYRLIGTQFFAADFAPVDGGARQPTEVRYNQPFYLANLVVETNTDLQNFQGLPPGVNLTPYYSDKVDIPLSDEVDGTTINFQREDDNLIFNRQNIGGRNMGGCMGCHGVAQLKGFNFSFVFAIGQTGSGLDTLDHFEVAGGQGPPEGSN